MERRSRQGTAAFLTPVVAGRVYLVGAGPGDPELITVKGLRLLEQADVVFYDRLVNPELLTRCQPSCRRIYAGKDFSGEVTQAAIHRWLIAAARKYPLVVRLKCGDPFIFGRGGEEVAALQEAGIPCEVVPGVSSAIAAPAAAAIPVLHRDLAHSITIVSGHSAGDHEQLNWRAAAAADTVVILMGVARLREIAGRLVAAGKSASTPVAIIQEATLPGQRVFTGTLSDIVERSAGVRSPAVIVVGAVAALAKTHEAENWEEAFVV